MKILKMVPIHEFGNRICNLKFLEVSAERPQGEQFFQYALHEARDLVLLFPTEPHPQAVLHLFFIHGVDANGLTMTGAETGGHRRGWTDTERRFV
ncbi:MAG: hypothetical protein C4520_01125 [Candidatus Abyssobacteria bacterium SURF_5]|uniref:Uncharacterized protein n=1 Tax=Abyssobacteria bacterium (strain SURF_5) TaxID=2093360 RepID=A0A3A4NZZ1_ABYX5|nr:MAG: hypothetical protein C4520_01125 [Candidatus Abyssubacteria bacterium SURF_5]